MNILGIETSSRVSSVAAMSGKTVSEVTGPSDAQHSITLIDDCRKAVAEAGIELKDLDRIAVGLGPGSFTGIRIGCTAAKSLAWSLGVEAGGVSTFQALAAQAASSIDVDGRTMYVVGDAWRMELFAGEYCLTEEGIREVFLGVITLKEADGFFKPGSIITGPGISLIKDAVPDMEYIDIEAPSASFVISEALRISEFKSALEGNIEPLYLKLSEPERNNR